MKFDNPVKIKIVQVFYEEKRKLFFDKSRNHDDFSIINESTIKSINIFNFMQKQNKLLLKQWPLLMKDLIQGARAFSLLLRYKIQLAIY